MADTGSTNPLVTTKASDTPTTVQLHPLVLLTVSDYVTRHTSRQQKGPIVGSVIGQQNGHAFTLEAAYECKLADSPDGSDLLDVGFFATRLEQYKDVHKVPPLDLVGLFMLGSSEGPTPAHAAFVKQVQTITSSDSIMLLLFHPELVHELQGGKLPVSVYESVQEQEAGDSQLKFREVTYEVETGDAERIAVDFVAQGGGNATAVPKADAAAASGTGSSAKGKGKGKAKAYSHDDSETGAGVLSPEDEELIASLTAKANAIKMLQQRIDRIRAYLATLPQSYLTDASSSQPPPADINYPLLRSIHALLSRLPLLTPPPTLDQSTETFPTTTSNTAADREKQDVYLTSLLSNLTRAVSDAQTLGAKFNVVQRDKLAKERGGPGGPGGRGGGKMLMVEEGTGGF